MKIFEIEYNASVNCKAGWGTVSMKAQAEKISEKRVKVIEVTHIDDKPITTKMSRTGSKRQTYDGVYFANAQINKIKNISSLISIR